MKIYQNRQLMVQLYWGGGACKCVTHIHLFFVSQLARPSAKDLKLISIGMQSGCDNT